MCTRTNRNLLKLIVSIHRMPSPTATSHFLAQIGEDIVSRELLFAPKVLHCKIVVRAGAVVIDASEFRLAFAKLTAHERSDLVKNLKAVALVCLGTGFGPAFCGDKGEEQRWKEGKEGLCVSHCEDRR